MRVAITLLLVNGLLCLFPRSQVIQHGGNAVTTCNGTYYDSGGVLGGYQFNENNIQTLCAEVGNRLTLDFVSFSTEEGVDILSIYDGPDDSGTLIGTFSGGQVPPTITSSEGCITLVFSSDGQNNYTGWVGHLSCQSCPNSPPIIMSNQDILSCSGQISDPGGGSNYANNQHVVESICAGDGNCFSFKFEELDMESCCDYLKIYDGPDTNSALIARFTGNNEPGVVFSSTGCMTLEFYSDLGNTDYAGFIIDYQCSPCPQNMSSSILMDDSPEFICSGSFFDSGGDLSPYGPNESFVKTFCSSNNDCIWVGFLSFSTQSGMDILEIFNGSSVNAPRIGTYSGNLTPGMINSTNGCLTFRFTSGATVHAAGWEAALGCGACIDGFQSCLPDMGSCYDLASSGDFFDPGGTSSGAGNNGYYEHTICSENQSCVIVDFTVFELESGFDLLHIYDGPNTTSPFLGTFTGIVGPGTLQSSSGCLTFVYTSDADSSSLGWEATISEGICPVMAEVPCLIDYSSHTAPPGMGPSCDDCSSSPILLPFPYFICGEPYYVVHINSNGNISMGNQFASFVPESFPNNSTAKMVAPFWSDTDARSCGQVKYELSSTHLIVTWIDQGYYPVMCDLTNTFQLIITDGSDPILSSGKNTSFRYGEMEWTTASTSGGYSGHYGAPVPAGINNNDGSGYSLLGTFDRPGVLYDGPFGGSDEVDYLDNSCFEFDGNECIGGSPIALDIQSINFQSELLEDNNVRLFWDNQNLVNAQSFLLEKAVETEVFFPLFETQSSGNTFQESFVDRDLVPGEYKYRLTTRLQGGESIVSQVEFVTIEGFQSEFCGNPFPNPISGEESLWLPLNISDDQKLEVEVHEVTGKLLEKRLFDISAQTTGIPLELNHLSKGIFFLTIKTSSGLSSTKKIIKK